MPRKIMNDKLFNDYLDFEMAALTDKFKNKAHYAAESYIIICHQITGLDVVFTKLINVPAGQSLLGMGLTSYLRQQGARFGLDHRKSDPHAIFVISPEMSMSLTKPGETAAVYTVVGVTNDGRSNLGVLDLQRDSSGRIYLEEQGRGHYGENSDEYEVNVLAYLEFFKINDKVRERLEELKA